MNLENQYIPYIVPDSVDGVGPLPLVAVPICVDVVGCEYDNKTDSWVYYVVNANDNIDDVPVLYNCELGDKVYRVKEVFKTLTPCNKACDQINKRIIKGWFSVFSDRSIDEIKTISQEMLSKQIEETKNALNYCKQIRSARKNAARQLEK
ncbi:MAG: hypothetical protein K6F08_01250 [bacterium]|nr:hypothetical protein [bacterium]